MNIDQSKRTICICDDDQEILNATEALLRSAGYEVVAAHEHKELNEKLQTCSPDLIILDVRMPERDGFWIAECLQVLGNKIPIIFMTGQDKLIYKLYAPFVGSVDYLIKPVDADVLLKKVDRALHAHAA
jgi:DNA-binding response OmpR family regulator